MPIFVRGLALACVLGFSSSGMAADAGAANPFLAGDTKAGETKAAVCAACHGPGGNSVVATWPKIAGQSANYLYGQLQAYKSGARKDPVMTAQVAAMSDKDMQDLAVYFAAQTQKPGIASEESIEVAQKLYRAGDAERAIPACSACHGPKGTGNPAAAYPRVGGQHAEYNTLQLKAYRAGSRNATSNAQMMSAVAAELTDEEIGALASYLNGLQ